MQYDVCSLSLQFMQYEGCVRLVCSVCSMRVVFAKSAIYAVWLCSLSLLFMQYDGCVRWWLGLQFMQFVVAECEVPQLRPAGVVLEAHILWQAHILCQQYCNFVPAACKAHAFLPW